MIDLRYIYGFFPPQVAANPVFAKQMLKEYLQLAILEHIASTPYAQCLSFIGGTNLRLVRGIDRFSEDLDFDCKALTADDFRAFTDSVVRFLQRNGLTVETRDKSNPRLTAYRRNLFFPQLLFSLGLTGHHEERFLIKIEAQDQGVSYTPVSRDVSGCGRFFPINVPPDGVLCAMKISALLTRAKGRDFYDTMFLLAQGVEPDYQFLASRSGVASRRQLVERLLDIAATTDLDMKKRDFAHLLFTPANCERITRFADFIRQWSVKQ